MTILITGATGLVGARLLPRLVASGFDCRALVRGGKDVPAGALAVRGDLFDPTSLQQAVSGISAVVHLAAVFRTEDDDLIWKSNVEGTRHLIGAVTTHAPHARFILASTSNVYDKHTPHPGREDDAPDPQHAYPASKLAAEKLLRGSDLNWAILRFPFVYGEGDGHLDTFPSHAIAGNWHPAQRMSTVHHRDIATAVRLALTGAMDRRIVNICDEAPTSVYELVRLVGATIPTSSEPLTIRGISTWMARSRAASVSSQQCGRSTRPHTRGFCSSRRSTPAPGRYGFCSTAAERCDGRKVLRHELFVPPPHAGRTRPGLELPAPVSRRGDSRSADTTRKPRDTLDGPRVAPIWGVTFGYRAGSGICGVPAACISRMGTDSIERALAGLDYPAPRNKLIATALQNGASRSVIDRLLELPETADFRDEEALRAALGVAVPGTHPRGWQ